jgi:peptidoglycan/LPS O-acetylase OafA/YrhL
MTRPANTLLGITPSSSYVSPGFKPQPEAGDAVLTRHRKPLLALTGIRFLASAYVVQFHTRAGEVAGEYGHLYLKNFCRNGYLAVPLFFLLSGLILAYTYAGQIERRDQVYRFWEARFARLWPAYFLSLLLSSATTLSFPAPARALPAILMVQAWNPFNVIESGDWNFVCWTLSAEALFYLCFPWFQRRLERYDLPVQLATLGVLLALCVFGNSTYHTLGVPLVGVQRYIPFPIYHLPEFFAGVTAGNVLLILRQRGKTGVLRIGSGGFTYLAATATVALLCRPEGPWASLVVPAFCALLFGLATENTWISRLLSTPALLLGGGVSYSMYLFQLPMKAWVSLLMLKLHIESTFGRMALTGICLIAFSYVVFRGVEEPARRLLRSMFAMQLAKRRGA